MPETALRVYRGTKYFSASLFEGSQRMSRRKQDHERGVKAPPDKEMAVASVRAPPTMSTGQISAPKASMICQGVPIFGRGSSFCAWPAARLLDAPSASSCWTSRPALRPLGAPAASSCWTRPSLPSCWTVSTGGASSSVTCSAADLVLSISATLTFTSRAMMSSIAALRFLSKSALWRATSAATIEETPPAPVWEVSRFLDAPSGVAEGRTGACSVDYLVLMLKRSMAIRCECVEVESPLTAHASDCTHFSLRPALNVRSR
mmetsp:Transcript_29252/g.58424  ORF Transcript_29252/g.58424 Transcript_29252/m.58424 type:complete len:261 (+) Transcript_29252:1047-1829(+)